MSRYRYHNRNYGNRNYNNYNNYNYYNYDNRDRFPEIARLPYRYLISIREKSGKYINPGVFDPNENKRHYKMNCHASFKCSTCGKFWTSNQVTVELWWNNGKRQFDVRMYGQQCKRCNGVFMIPYIDGIENIVDICVTVLTTDTSRGRGMNVNKNTNTEFNSSHDQQRCQKCQLIHRPCWE